MKRGDKVEVILWDHEPVIGERVEYTVRFGKTTQDACTRPGVRAGGVYEGVVEDEEDGTPMHRFHDGYIGVTPQGHHGFPVGYRDGGLIEVRAL